MTFTSTASQPNLRLKRQIEAACAVIRCYGGHVSDDWSYFSGLWDDGCGFTMITRSLLFEEEAKPFGAAGSDHRPNAAILRFHLRLRVRG